MKIRATHASWILIASLLTLSFLVTGLAFGQASLRLPSDFTFSQSEGSPGKVTFRHGSHIDMKQPNCTACHSQLFRILEAGMPAEGGKISHERMQAGRQCGACHSGKSAFDLQNCPACHRAE
ncbi:MAG: hypothetical protein HYY65_14480 [Candidatus Tectomicrobia bacterium]|uniref:Cytochrome c7-like domain-containing protein n=1 Tax=Tectimicrobiota bacterium TaxID=2528274 RepID=A0A932GSU6_UNCTE|nr:hypothetical protein [Candidatus Tectomicrobia bacterium]